MAENMMLDLSSIQDQNKLAVAISGYLTREELLEIDLKNMIKFWQIHGQRGYLHSEEALKSNNVIYYIKFDKSKTSLKIVMYVKTGTISPLNDTILDYIGIKIKYRDSLSILFKILPNPKNPQYISLSLGKAINYISYKGNLDKLYNNGTIRKNLELMIIDLLKSEEGGVQSFYDFFDMILDDRGEINIKGFKKIVGPFEYCIDLDYLDLFCFYIKSVKTGRIEIIFFEHLDIKVFELMNIFGSIFRKISL